MIERRPFNELAGADHGWLKAKHHFSFGEFADPTPRARTPEQAWARRAVGEGVRFLSESRMRAIRTSGSMRGM